MLYRSGTFATPLRSYISLFSRAMSTTHYAAVVIGSGQGGGPLAQAFAKSGQKTALIESTHIGGTCINEGCTPTKTMVASARIAHLTGRASTYGVQFKKSSLTMNMETVRKRKRDIVDSFRGGGENRIKSTENLDLLTGKAKFTGPKTIEVVMNETRENKTITADKIFINAGCSPAKLDAKHADVVPVLNSTTIMELGEVPKHLVVVGGGYVGIEFAQMFRRFGAKVSIVQRSSRLLPREDADVSEEVKKILTEDGIDIYLNAKTDFVTRVPVPQTILSIKIPSQGDEDADDLDANGLATKSLMCSHLLSAAGRVPNTHDLDLSSAGIETDSHGFIKVSSSLETSAKDIYALGDIKGGPQFTHISYDDFRILQHNLLRSSSSTQLLSTKDRLVPYTVFMDPQLGRIGHSESSARSTFPERKLQVAKMPMAYVARALETDETRGFMKAIVDAETKEILGFACLGIEGGEIMSMIQIAMMGKLPYDALQNAVFAHPCLSESLNNLWGFLEDMK